MMKKKPKFQFCDDLDSPELCVILDLKWFDENADEIVTGEGIYIDGKSYMLLIPKPEDRMTFTLRWA